MQVYHYCLVLLGLVAISSSRYIDRSYETDRDDNGLNLANHFYRVRAYQPVDLERYLRHLIALDAQDDYAEDEPTTFERRSKAITKGDPREFMG